VRAWQRPQLVESRSARPAPETRQLFEELVRVHDTALFATACKLCGNAADARDLVQDTFERALRGFDQFTPGTNGRAWLVSILHHRFIDLVRRRASGPRTESAHELNLPADPPAPDPAWTAITPDQVRAAVARLSDEFRVVYELHALERRSYGEIA